MAKSKKLKFPTSKERFRSPTKLEKWMNSFPGFSPHDNLIQVRIFIDMMIRAGMSVERGLRDEV